MSANWYENFFHGVALDLWRQAVTPEQTRAEADFLERELQVSPGARLLDVPCGNGRHAIELARRGYRLSGVDLSEEFIREAQERSAAAGAEIEWILEDMRRLPWESEFDGAFCLGNSFGYLDHPGTEDFLAALARAMKPRARFVLQTGLVAESILPLRSPQEWWKAGDILLLVHKEYDIEEGRLNIDYTFIHDGQVETRPGSQGVYTVAEIRRMLARAGLRALSLFGDVAGTPYRVGSPGLLLVAQK